jgi:spore maturation protein CgeB
MRHERNQRPPAQLDEEPPMSGMQIAWFGSSLVSAYWNGAATYYRGMVRALANRGHRVTFFEPDAWDRQQHRDIDDPSWAEIVVWDPNEDAAAQALDRARGADLVIKASGVGVLDAFLEDAVLDLQGPATRVAFWDVDAPATLGSIDRGDGDALERLIPRYDMVLTYGGGPPVVAAYERLGARLCRPIYNAVDPDVHRPVEPDPAFAADLAFLGNRLPDREERIEDFFVSVAEALSDRRFLLGGSGWADHALPPNVRPVGHVYTRDHNAFNCTPLAVLNVNRENMAQTGYSPATRVFEAAGAGACLITDRWKGIEQFLEPDHEVLVASDGAEVRAHLEGLDEARAERIGDAARRRVLAEHTYEHRAAELESLLDARELPCAS